MTPPVVALPDPATARVAVIGLGYVGLPLLLAFARRQPVLGFDRSAARIDELRRGIDRNDDIGPDDRALLPTLAFTADAADLAGCEVYVIAVPTPVNADKLPDLGPLIDASRAVGRAMARGALVVYESTVYPGATEDVCVPELESASGLRCNVDFHVGYSPERINPGDTARGLADIVKVTSGSTPAAGDCVDALYAAIVPAGTHRAPDIRTAEMAKAIENTQRDVNIALMNELAQFCARLGMDSGAVLAAARTKWNFLPFSPGLVGGHCIGVDPYYLIHRARAVGYEPALIASARARNEGMAGHVVERLAALLAARPDGLRGARVLVLGATFKEHCRDLRNSQVAPIVRQLQDAGCSVDLVEPWADPAACVHEIGLAPLQSPPGAGAYDAVLAAVAHREFAALDAGTVRGWLRPGGVVFDVKRILPAAAVDAAL